MESANPWLPRVVISKTTFIEHEVASEEIGRLRAAMGIGEGGLYQAGIFQDLSTKSSFPLSSRGFL
jgi:hypothetical protein